MAAVKILALRGVLLLAIVILTAAGAMAVPSTLAEIDPTALIMPSLVPNRQRDSIVPDFVWGSRSAQPANAGSSCSGNQSIDQGDDSEAHRLISSRYAFPPSGRKDGSAGETEPTPALQRQNTETPVACSTSSAGDIALAECHRLRGDLPAAEAALQRTLAVTPTGAARTQLLELYVLEGKTDAALAFYTKMTDSDSDAWAAKKRVAELFLDRNNLNEAAPRIYALLAITTADLELHYLHARMLLLKGDVSAAIHQLQQVLREGPSFERARLWLALALLRDDKSESASAELTECLRNDPDFVQARYLLAQLQGRAGHHDLAQEEARRVLAVFPRSIDMLMLLSDAALAGGDAKEARRIAEEMVRDAPERCEGHYRLARALVALGAYVEAQSAFERTVALSPGSIDALAELIGVFRAARRPDDEVVRWMTAHVDAHPALAPAWLLLGQLTVATGDLTSAGGALEAAVRLDPKLVAARRLLSTVYVKQGRLADARSQLEQIIAADPDDVGAHMVVGLIDDSEGRHADAARRYQRVLDIDPKFAPAGNNLAWHYAERDGNLDLALLHAREAHTDQPTDPRITDTMGWILYRQRNFSTAIRYLEESAKGLPANAEVRYHLGIAYRHNDNLDKARRELRAALNLGSFPDADAAQHELTAIGW